MAIIETALVSNGNLLIQLDDGTIVNAGRVAGPQGPQGLTGAEGPRGADGRNGIDGADGARWHTGVGAPELGLGTNGDLYMDVASALLPIFQKVNGEWIFLANLKPTPHGAGVGGGSGAAGGGGSVIIHPGPQPPIEDNDGRPIDEGDLWVDINGNHLYVYYNGVWSEVTTCSVGGGGATGDFLKRYGDDVDDATENAVYKWNTALKLTGEDIYLEPEDDLYCNTNEAFIRSDGANLYLRETLGGLSVGTSFLEIDYDRFRIHASGGDPIQITTDGNVELGRRDQTPIVTVNGTDNKGYYDGLIEDDTSLVNKQYVDAQAEFTQREVEVLQEEIEAITPTTDKGIWQDGASATPGTGHFAMRRQGGAITQSYLDTDIDTIIVSTTDKDGGGHSFTTEEVGDLIQLFDVEDKNYGLFEIEAIDTATTTEYVSFTVKWLQGIGETNVDDDVLIKTFAPPTGGTASEFLPLAGGVMIGEVQWNKTDSASFSGINLVTSISDPNVPDDANGRVFYANMGASYQPPRVLCGVPPTEPQSVVNKKYVDSLFDFSQYDELT